MNQPSDDPKRIQTCFRLTPRSREHIFAKAAAAGVSPREWLDKAIIDNRTTIIAKQKTHVDLKPLLFQVNKAGNNLNQLAHHFNTLKLEGKITRDEFKASMDQLQQIQDAMQEALNRAR